MTQPLEAKTSFQRLTQANSWVAVFVMMIAAGSAVASRTWEPLHSFAAFLGAVSLVAGSATALAGAKVEQAFRGFFVVVLTVATAYVAMGLLAAAERFAWSAGDSYPRFLLARQFTTRFDVTDYRMLRLACDIRNEHSLLETREDGGTISGRCGGDWYPAAYTFTAPASEFRRAQGEFAKDPDAPIVLKPGEGDR